MHTIHKDMPVTLIQSSGFKNCWGLHFFSDLLEVLSCCFALYMQPLDGIKLLCHRFWKMLLIKLLLQIIWYTVNTFLLVTTILKIHMFFVIYKTKRSIKSNSISKS